jgi:hypothetical protein
MSIHRFAGGSKTRLFFEVENLATSYCSVYLGKFGGNQAPPSDRHYNIVTLTEGLCSVELSWASRNWSFCVACRHLPIAAH